MRDRGEHPAYEGHLASERSASERPAAREYTPPALRALDLASAAAHPVPLAEVMARASLLARFDRVHLVPARTFVDFAARLTDPRAPEPFRVLSIDGLRCFRYHSVYYDTAGLRAYHDHRQGRRRRFKIRERRYEHSGERQFEVKLKGRRGETVKYRTPLAASGPALGEGTRRFLTGTLRSAYGVGPPEVLLPSLVTDYARITLVADGMRVTCDAGLVCRTPTGGPGGTGGTGGRGGPGGGPVVHGDGELVLVETKSTGRLTDVDRLLHRYGIRPAEFTKYAALAALSPALRGNRWRRALRQVFPGQ
ncbi:VTC domain-containing protein [Streptomyces sp. Amel2xB2]|uniref:VTC domain-containing protein n=1 Tax=Streptomyces sp. Amel2xB2 TaxID=1305829 RepID=UPI000DB9F645|nr:VTC domain-containing protein [Streptomyces sp. Amel2xB2]RAJ61790.1 VTC domain-containing protein [Streptomyces sp. Amel2xB2]